MSDVAAVADCLDLRNVQIVAADTASPVAIAYAALKPARVSRLVLVRAFADGRRSWVARLSDIVSLTRRDWPLDAETIAHATMGWARERAQRYAKLLIQAADPPPMPCFWNS